jgi:hypothetical protein
MVSIGGRTGMQNKKTQGLFKGNDSIEPWIFDPTAVAAVDHAVSPVHGSTVDQAKGYPPDLIRTVRGRSHDPGREHARAAAGMPGQRGDGGTRRRFAGASPRRGSRWPKRARVSATRSGEAHEHA